MNINYASQSERKNTTVYWYSQTTFRLKKCHAVLQLVALMTIYSFSL